MLRGYEVAPNQYVTVKQEELRQLKLPTSSTMEILRTTKLPEIDPVYFETSYYVVPERMGERAYALFYAALQETNYAALAKVAMHGREHIMLVRPGKKGLLAHTMYYPAEVRADQEFKANAHAVSDKELELAKTLVRSLEAPFKPEKYHDTYREKLEAILKDKAKGKHVKVEAGEPRPKPAKVVDIADALRKSLANLKKPAQRQPARKTRKAAGH